LTPAAYAQQLTAQTETAKVIAQHLTQDGQAGGSTVQRGRVTLRAILNEPLGQSASVKSVSFIHAGGEVPRFVNAYLRDGL
jgi:hypothetical protein